MSAFEYAPALESTSIVNIAESYKLFINGKFVAPKSGKYFPTVNPQAIDCPVPFPVYEPTLDTPAQVANK